MPEATSGVPEEALPVALTGGPAEGPEGTVYSVSAGFAVGRNRRGKVEMRFSAVTLIDGDEWWWSTRRVCDPSPYRFRRGRRLNVLRIDEWRSSRKRRRDGEPIWASLTSILAEWTRACDQLRAMGLRVHQIVGNLLYGYTIATPGALERGRAAAPALALAVARMPEQDRSLSALSGGRRPRGAAGKVTYDEWGYPVGVTGLEERYEGRVVAAVDASLLDEGSPQAIFGAVVNSEGWCRVKQFPHARTSNRAEKEALSWALTVMRRRSGTSAPLLLADSADTVATTAPPKGTRGKAVVRWVPGHLGHPLNEGAHHLAFGANRAFLLGRLDEFHREIRPLIAAEAKRQWRRYRQGQPVSVTPYRKILERAGLVEKN
ncbi:hypothetical protein QP119_05135 [Corynebacterium frankenforstense]|uniref:hypothetical protein n=1 Tax=Corynebacterium frankenforstense TaxID=1230998 RepID=UPI00255194DF|nr:hypothetical protein [Corynebacterium frankenforstense]MDK6259807.1 hypothetical protein [Corynebacterium frankenforstense]